TASAAATRPASARRAVVHASRPTSAGSVSSARGGTTSLDARLARRTCDGLAEGVAGGAAAHDGVSHASRLIRRAHHALANSVDAVLAGRAIDRNHAFDAKPPNRVAQLPLGRTFFVADTFLLADVRDAPVIARRLSRTAVVVPDAVDAAMLGHVAHLG